ncbi:unnamed protein product [Thelazia callipaeda]|uniref:PNP_UDP_1 domain-containing protein n=1 Tax=Thelazia callipaeda TaxID=103827 RepID=A0A158RC16_THECL|nr:unnamed protein product [Thelazia callipaeda]
MSDNKMVQISNPNLDSQLDDCLCHLGIFKSMLDLPMTFGDVKFLCMGGSERRIRKYAEMFAEQMNLKMSENFCKTDRYVMYKTGQVLWVNHGIGIPSLSIILVEVIKLLHHAKAKEVVAIRIGTSGGLGLPPGTLILSNKAVNGELQDQYVQYIMGKKVLRSANFDAEVLEQLQQTAIQLNLPVQVGKTFCTDDFYEGQARMDGAFCDYTVEQKFAFLNHLYDLGVRNIEMESLCFAALLNRSNIRSAVVCVSLVNRLKGDQIKLSAKDINEFEMSTYKLVSEYIRKQLRIH